MSSSLHQSPYNDLKSELGPSTDFLLLAKQVAHDIRSPLSALNFLLQASQQMPEESRVLAQAALKRINEIASDLLSKSRSPQKANNNPEQIVPLVAQIVSEKKLLLQEKNVKIEYDISKAFDSICFASRSDLQRVISNLLNNAIEAIEALENRSGKVLVAIVTSQEQVQIRITDTGKGIPENILSQLGKPGFSHGKSSTDSGFGLGLSHAKTTIESLGGQLRIESVLGQGTTVSILLPRVGN